MICGANFEYMNGILLFDLDNTLISTERIKAHLYSIAVRHGYDKNAARNIYKEARFNGKQNTICYRRFLQVLKERLFADGKEFIPNVAAEVEEKLKKDSDLLLPGAEKFLQECQGKKKRKILLSLGVAEWQDEKIKWSGLDKYFSREKGEIVFTQLEGEGKIEAIKILFGENFDGMGVTLFNDKPDETRDVLAVFPKMKACVRQEVVDKRYKKEDFAKLLKDFEGRLTIFDEWNSLIEGIEKKK